MDLTFATCGGGGAGGVLGRRSQAWADTRIHRGIVSLGIKAAANLLG